MLEVGEGGPEESHDEVGVVVLVAVRDGFAGRRGHPEPEEGGALEAQLVAHIVEVDGMGELREEHHREKAADGEMAGFRFHP